MATQIIQDLQAMPFGAMIGGPLSACIEAQKEAALTTVEFIRNVGFAKKEVTENGKTKEVISDEVINVTFMYKRENNMVELTVPLLTIVPIPFIAIDTVNINFKATLNMAQRDKSKESDVENSYQNSRKTDTGKGVNVGWGHAEVNRSYSSMYGSVSTKKDSVSTQTSSYSVEATIDINVVAHQESMPAGMSKVLEMLNQAIFLQPEGNDAKIERLESELAELKKQKAE